MDKGYKEREKARERKRIKEECDTEIKKNGHSEKKYFIEQIQT